MRTLSKSKILSYVQCPKRLWLEIHRPEYQDTSPATEARLQVGHVIGEIARQIYDPKGKGTLIALQANQVDLAITQTSRLLNSAYPIFEAGFSTQHARAFADVLLPVKRQGKRAWRMVEVKSSGSVKDYHCKDVAIQAYVAREAGLPIASVSLAHVDTSWTYPGGENYDGLLIEEDLSKVALGDTYPVHQWIADAQSTLIKRKEPRLKSGNHCFDPFECGFINYCHSQESDCQSEFPIQWLPGIQSKALKTAIQNDPAMDLRSVPDNLLNDIQQRVKTHSLSGKTYFDALGASKDLAAHKLPAYFLDFETVSFAVPIWKGTSPYQQIPFQFSLHRMARNGKLEQTAFLDISGKDPRKAFAESLIGACGERGPIFAYGAKFEKGVITKLAERFPSMSTSLLALNDRIVDLLPIAQQRFYHPSQQGSWSIKNVLPAIAPELNYEQLDGVQNGVMAMEAYKEAIHPQSTMNRKAEIQKQLLEYCCLDTLAMVKIWQFFSKIL